MSPLPLISVVTPTARCGPSVERALASVRRQDYPRLEHVVVGDACVGPALDRLTAIAHSVPETATLRVVVNAPSPDADTASYRPARAAHARTIGVRASTGTLIAFLDDDNEFEPNHISTMFRTFRERTEVRAVYSWRQLVTREGSPYLRPASPWEGDPKRARQDYDDLVAAGVWIPGTNLMRDSLEYNTVDSSCWLIERELLDAVPFRLAYDDRDRSEKLGEDVAFCFDIKEHAIPVACTGRHSVRYYLGGFSTGGSREYTYAI